MRRTLFKRYLAFCITIVLVSFAILGSLLMGFLGRFWTEEKRSMLSESSAAVSSLAKQYLPLSLDSRTRLSQVLLTISKTIEGDIYIVNTSGETILCSDNAKMQPCMHRTQLISERIMAIATVEAYDEVGDLDGMFDSSYYTVAVPMYYRDGSVAGAIFASTSSGALTEYVFELFRMFLLSAVLVLLFVVAIAYMLTARLTKPLRQMADAARRMSRGDFSKRVPVNENDELSELALAFNNMASSLAMLEQMRRSFIANVSHELKTPMTTIAGFIDGMLDGTIGADKTGYYLEIVSDEVKRLSRVVTSMLSLSKLDAGEMKTNPEVFDLSETLLRSLISFEQRIEEKKLVIEGVDNLSSAVINADPDLIHQVIYNLLDNAVKFTPKQGTIRLGTAPSSDTVSFTIKNSGPGIPQKDLPNIFERFYKADRSRGMDKSGTGLGLYLVKAIVSVHGGHITVRSKEGESTEFEVTLRLHKPATSDKKEKAELSDKKDKR